jgi:hypothetical protein
MAQGPRITASAKLLYLEYKSASTHEEQLNLLAALHRELELEPWTFPLEPRDYPEIFGALEKGDERMTVHIA